MDHFPLMARFNAWANARLFGCVAQLSEAAYKENRKAFFGSIHNTLNHVLVGDRLWCGRIEGTDHGITALDQILFDDFDTLRAARVDHDKHFIDLVDSAAKDGLDRVVSYMSVDGPEHLEARVGHIFMTLLNHQTHHRGQVHAMLTQQDIDPPALDVIFFLIETGEAGPPGAIGAGPE